MSFQRGLKFNSIIEFWDFLPSNEYEVADILHQIAVSYLPSHHKERLSYNVPFFYLIRRVCFIWPASIPWGGFKEGVMFGFCYGNRLKDKQAYLTHGTNKQVFYKIYKSANEIDEEALAQLISESIEVDKFFK